MERAETAEGIDICPSSSFFPKKLPFKASLVDTKLLKSWIRREQESKYHYKDLAEACLPFLLCVSSLTWLVFMFACYKYCTGAAKQ